jgi:DNA-binding NarL/FixJ family response regulator
MKVEKSSYAASISILLVDDVEHWRRSVCSMLTKHEGLHVVSEAADGFEAVQKAEELQPDVILLDIGLPNLNGIEAARRIAEVASDAKILFLTQNIDADLVQLALSDGAKGYVAKVDAGRELVIAIETVFRGEKFVSSRLRD